MNVVSCALYRHAASAYESERAGAGRGVFFKGFLPAVIRAHRSVYPDWELQIRHDEQVVVWPYWKVLQLLQEAGAGVKLIPMGEAHTLCGSMLWRLYPAFDASSEAVICRDIDSLPMPRGRRAVQRWLGSGEPFHSMQDSRSHSSARIMGGMLGLLARSLREVFPDRHALESAIVTSGIDMNKHGADQAFLHKALGGWNVRLDTPDTLGDRTQTGDPRDTCGGHAVHEGGAFHAQPVARWYDLMFPDKLILDCEKAAGWTW